MYRYGENHIRRRHRNMALLVVGLLLLGWCTVWLVHTLRSKTVIASASPAVTSQVTMPIAKTTRIDEAAFSLDVPQDWKLQSHNTTGVNIYTWANTASNPGVRSLSLYLDTPEPSLGVNRALSVERSSGHIIATSDVSDSCASFTGKPTSGMTDAVPAKWNGINFLCDIANYERDVVGIVSSDGINQLMLKGAAGDQHNVFFTYTDSSDQPDYSIFVSALQSFRLK